MDAIVRRVQQYIIDHQQEAFEYLRQTVREASLQGHEKSAQEVVIAKLNSLGLKTDTWEPGNELSNHPYFVATRPSFAGSPNVVGVWKGTGGGRSILLNGHIDVVPEGDKSRWTTDPYGGEIKDGKMYGRGTTDMKGGNAAMLFALEAIIKCGIRLKGDVIFESVIEEESGGAGTLATIVRGYTADAALVPEPTNMKMFIKQQGSMWFRIAIEGKSAHAGTRYEGVSALEKAWKVHAAILALEERRNARVKDALYQHIPIPLPINVGRIQGGNWPSSVPELVTMEGRIGVGPEETIDQVKAELIDAIRQLSISDDWLREHPAQVSFFGAQWVPNAIEASHDFVGTVSRHYASVYGKAVRMEASPWGTDAGLLGKVGNIPAIVMGPGETKMAHFPDEYIDLSEMIRCSQLFAGTMLEWCEVA